MIALRKPIPVSRKKGVPAPFALTVIVVETLLGAEIVIDTEYAARVGAGRSAVATGGRATPLIIRDAISLANARVIARGRGTRGADGDVHGRGERGDPAQARLEVIQV